MYLSLALSLGSILYGAGSWAWSRWGNAGLSVTIVNQLFTAASGT